MGRPRKFQPAKEVIIREDAQLKWRNELVSGKWSLSLNETRMLYIMASHINKGSDEFEYCKVSASDLGKAMGLSPEKQYQTIKEVADKLSSRKLKFEWYKTSRSTKKSWLVAPWFSYICYDHENAEVEWRFNDLITPVLLKVKEAYVKTLASPLVAFRCNYSSRFMLLFLQWEKMGERTIGIEELKEHFGIADKYKFFKDFNVYVVKPAIEEINALTEFNIKATPVKVGRKYTQYNFVIRRKKIKTINTTASAVAPSFTDEQQKLFDELVRYGVDRRWAAGHVAKRHLDDIRKNIDWALKHREHTENFAGYLRSCCDEDYGISGLFGEMQQAAAAEAKLSADQRADLEAARRMAKEAAAQEAAKDNIAPMTIEEKRAAYEKAKAERVSAALAGSSECS